MNQTNDFAFKIATANGTGSASANGLIMQAIFRMGIPVTGKNVFLRTFRVCRPGTRSGSASTATRQDAALRPDGGAQSGHLRPDVAEVRSGGWLLYDSTWPLDQRLLRPDVTYLGIPFAEMCNARFSGMRERILMKNIAYAGALAALLNMDRDIIRALLKEKFGRKPALMDSNQRPSTSATTTRRRTSIARSAPAVAARSDPRRDFDRRQHRGGARLPLRRRHGRRLVSDHARDVVDGSLQGLLPEISAANQRAIETGQAEDEIAAIGMVIGASWAGARAFTPTAGPASR